MMARSASEASITRDLNTTSKALCLSRTSTNELASATGSCAAAEKQRTNRSREGVNTFILPNLLITLPLWRSSEDEAWPLHRLLPLLARDRGVRFPGPSGKCNRCPRLYDAPV